MSESVLTPEELEALAKKDESMPKGLNSAQIAFYQNMIRLCKNYRMKAVTKEQARSIKKEIYEAFYIENRMVKIWENTLEIRKKLGNISKQAYTGTCENCKKMIKIFDGFITDELV